MTAIALQGANNIRDLGGIRVEGRHEVLPGLLYRGSSLDKITEADSETLFNKLGIACVIDLRCGWERDAKPDLLPASVENLHIPFYDLDIVGIEYTEPAEGTKVVGRDVACDPDRFYRSLANPLTVGQMRKGLACAFEHAERGKPVYVHCSGGKDRAGIFSLLLLTALGASRESILEDYLLTNIDRDKDYERMLQRFLVFANGDEQRARELTHAHRARPENLSAFYDAVDARYGSMDAFLHDGLGIDGSARNRARLSCTRPVML